MLEKSQSLQSQVLALITQRFADPLNLAGKKQDKIIVRPAEFATLLSVSATVPISWTEVFAALGDLASDKKISMTKPKKDETGLLTEVRLLQTVAERTASYRKSQIAAGRSQVSIWLTPEESVLVRKVRDAARSGDILTTLSDEEAEACRELVRNLRKETASK